MSPKRRSRPQPTDPACYAIAGSRVVGRHGREACHAVAVGSSGIEALARLLEIWPSFWPEDVALRLHPARIHEPRHPGRPAAAMAAVRAARGRTA